MCHNYTLNIKRLILIKVNKTRANIDEILVKVGKTITHVFCIKC